MYGEEPGEPLPVKLIHSYMAHCTYLFWVEIHREADYVARTKRKWIEVIQLPLPDLDESQQQSL